jgi:DNA-binding CsgD family transcriptional regulator
MTAAGTQVRSIVRHPPSAGGQHPLSGAGRGLPAAARSIARLPDDAVPMRIPPPPVGLLGVEVLDAFPRPVLGLDGQGRLALANRAGRALLGSARSTGLTLDPSGRLTTEAPDADRLLRRLLVRAAAGEGFGSGMPLGMVPVLRAEAPPLHLCVLPAAAAPAPANDAGGGRRLDLVALLLVLDPEQRPSSRVASNLLQEAYGLTRTEAAVALRVAEGEGLPAVAAERGIAPSTARSHLRRVFEKTGTRRQAQLARLLAQVTG